MKLKNFDIKKCSVLACEHCPCWDGRECLYLKMKNLQKQVDELANRKLEEK